MIIINYLIDVVRKNEFVCNECMNKYGYDFFKIWIFVVCGVFICWKKLKSSFSKFDIYM